MLPRKDFIEQVRIRVGLKRTAAAFSNSVSIQQETSERVIVAVEITDDTSCGQVDWHLVPSLQLHSGNNGAAVFRVLAVSFDESGHCYAIDQQIGAGSRGSAGGTPVDGDGEAVHTRAGDGEDAILHIVALSQVDEDMLVGDEPVLSEGAKAVQLLVIVKSNREGTAAG